MADRNQADAIKELVKIVPEELL
ncbi:MAG: hypothetical protein AAF585_13695 [Verrucomicrobiota bacterium]